MSRRAVLVDLERLKYPYTGLYHFCLQLSSALIRNNQDLDLHFYLPQKARNLLPANATTCIQRNWHKLKLPGVKNLGLWHAMHQDTDYFPQKEVVPVLLTIHDLNYLHDESKSEQKRLAFHQAVQKKISRASRLVSISAFTRDDVMRNFDCGKKPHDVIYNGCNTEELPSVSRPQNAPDPGKFIYTLGTIAPKKNFHVLPCLLINNDLKLIISGLTHNEEYKSKIVQEASRYGVADRVIFSGPVEENDKQWYLKNCRLFVFPSVAEGFGLPVIEAMYFGKPVLLSTHTSLPEIGGDAAWYMPTFQAEQMISAFNKCLADYDADPAAPSRIKARALSFNWDQAAQDYLSIYRQMLHA